MCARRLSGRLENSPMSRPPKVTDSASRRSRFPPHSGQSAETMNRETRFFMSALSVVANVWRTYFFADVKVPM
jgi:hypothetical protein